MLCWCCRLCTSSDSTTRSFVVRYDVIYHLSLINSQYLMTWEVDSPGNVFLGLTCNSQSLSPSLNKNTIAISFAILNSQDLFSVLFLRQITLWFGNPKSLQSLQNAPRDITNFAVYKETLGTFVPRHQGTCRIIPSKPPGLWKMALICRPFPIALVKSLKSASKNG